MASHCGSPCYCSPLELGALLTLGLGCALGVELEALLALGLALALELGALLTLGAGVPAAGIAARPYRLRSARS